MTEREHRWKRDYGSREHYERSVAANRLTFRHIVGANDERSARFLKLQEGHRMGASFAKGANYKVYAVRWPFFPPVTSDSGRLDAEGLLLPPNAPPVARVVAIPDADWTPEMLSGLAPGLAPAAQFARRLAENGCEVMVPMIINREDTFSGIPGIRHDKRSPWEWIYRMAYEVGRHIIGYEVQKVLAAVDWFERENINRHCRLG